MRATRARVKQGTEQSLGAGAGMAAQAKAGCVVRVAGLAELAGLAGGSPSIVLRHHARQHKDACGAGRDIAERPDASA